MTKNHGYRLLLYKTTNIFVKVLEAIPTLQSILKIRFIPTQNLSIEPYIYQYLINNIILSMKGKKIWEKQI